MKKNVTISATIAALTSVTGSIPLSVAGVYVDSITGTEIVKGVGFSLLDKNFVTPADIKIDIYNVSNVAPNEKGVYDLTKLTPVKSFVTPKSNGYTPYTLGLDSGKYVAKITPSSEYVINNYYSSVKNATNEVIFDVNDSISWISLGFLSISEKTTDNLNVYLQTYEGYPISNVTAKVTRIGLDGTAYELGEYKSDDTGRITCPADVTDTLPAGSIYSFELLNLPEEYIILHEKSIQLQAIEGLNEKAVFVCLKEDLGTCEISVLHTDYARMMSNCPVLIVDSDGKTYEYQTDDTGYLKIRDLPEGTYTLYYNGDDTNLTFEPETFSISSDSVSSGIVFVSNIEVAGVFEIYSFPGVKVNIVDTNTGVVVDSHTIDDKGHILTKPLPVGEYRIEPIETPENIKIKSETIEIRKSSLYYVSLDKVSEEDLGCLDIYVMDENGEPITDLEVDIYKESGEYVETACLNSDGVIYTTLPYGNYYLNILNVPSQYQSDNGTYTKTFSIDSDSVILPVVLQKAQEIVGKCSIDLEIWNVDTKSYVVNQKVTILNDKNIVCGEATTDESGIASFTKLPYGTYHFVLSEESGAYILDNQPVTVDKDHKMALHTVEAKNLTTTLVLSAQCPNADVVKNLSISLYKNEKLFGTYRMENGTISIDKLTAGSYRVELNDEISGYKVTSDLDIIITTSDKTINKTIVLEVSNGKIQSSVKTKDGKPVESVYVSLIDEKGNIVANDYTNENGIATFEAPTGIWTANAEVPAGYEAIESQTVEVKENEITELNFVTRMFVGSAKINVIDEYAEAVTNAEIALIDMHNNTVWTGTTDETGLLTIDKLPLGAYTIKAVSYDLEAYNPPANKALEILEEKEYAVDFVFDRIKDKVTTGNMTLTLKDEDGNIVNAEDLVVALYDSNDVMIDVVYVESGIAKFENLVESDYVAKLYSVSSPYLLSDNSNVSFTIHAEDELTADMTVYKGMGNVEFNIFDSEFNTGINGIEIELFRNEISIGSYKSENGLISISDLEQGTYTYKVTNLPDEYENIAVGSFIVEHEQTTTIDLALIARTGQGVVNVVDNHGNLLTNPVTMTLTHKNGTVYTGTAHNGVLNTGWLRAGKWTVTVETEINGYTLKTVEDVVIVPDETKTYQVVFEKDLGSASIKVEAQNLAGNIGLANVEVEIYANNNELFGVYKTDSNGNISISEMPIGKYSAKIVESSLPSGYVLLAGTDFEVSKNETSDVVVYALRATGTLQIRVQDDEEMALSNVTVVIRDTNGNVYKELETNTYGNITLSEVPTGTYTLEINSQNGYSAEGDFVAIVNANETTNKTLTLKRDKGSLKIVTSPAVSNVFFELYDGDTVVGEGYTDLNGEAIVENIPTGNYTFKVAHISSKYKTPVDTTVTILKNTETLLNLDIEEKNAKVSVEFKYQVTGYPTSGVEFRVTTVDGKEVGKWTTDETGIVDVQLGIGYYYVETLNVPDGYDIPAKKLIQIKDETDKTVSFELVETKHYGTLALSCVDSETTNPLMGAEIVLYDSNGGVYKTFETDDSGQIYDEEIEAGSYTAVITMADYEDQTISLNIEDNGFFAQTIYMEKVQEFSTLTVIVSDDKNTPLINAPVYLRDEMGNIVQRGYTDNEGILILRDILFGNYTLSVEVYGYKSSGRIETIIDSEEEVATIKLSPITTGSVSISVVDEDGYFIPNTVVSIDGPNSYHAELTTNAIGMAMISDLEAGEYTFSVKADGYVEYSQTVAIEANKTNFVDIILEEIDIGSAEITVTDEDGNALSGATVILSDNTLTTDENGVVRFDDLLAGEYSMVVSKDGYDSKTIQFVVEKDSTTKVKLALNKTITTGNIKLTVSNENGKALKDVSVTIGENSFMTDENGQVVVNDLEAGDYVVKMSKDGYVTKELPITISARATVEVNATLIKEVTSGTVNFSVKDTEGNALENTTIILSNGEELTTDESGFATIDLEFGEYSVHFFKEGYIEQFAELKVEAQKIYTVTASLAKEITTGNLEVAVKGNDGNILPEATVVATNGIDSYTLMSDENGIVSFEKLPVGEYELTISKTGYVTQNTTVTIVENQITRITATLERDITTGSLTVVVEDTAKNKLANASVVITNGINEFNLKTNENGELTFEDLSEGEWNVSVSLDGYVSATYKANIEAKKNTTMTVTLAKEIKTGDLNVKVSDVDGNVLSGATVEVVRDDFSLRYSTNDSGNVSFEDLEAGEYTVTISKNGYVERTTTVTIEAKKIVSIDVSLEKEIQKGNLEVIVNKHDETPAIGAIVTIRDKYGIDYGVYTADENGKITVEDMMIGEYHIEAYLEIDSEYGVYIEDKFKIVDKETTQITLTLPEPQEPVTTGDAKITVVDNNGKALENALVEISNGTSYFEAKTDVNGMISFSELDEGEYSVNVTLDGYESYETTINIVADETTELTATLKAITVGALDFLVVDTDDKPLTNASVTVFNNDGFEKTMMTDESGKIFLSELEAGTYTVIANLDGYLANNQQIVIESNKTTTAKMTLTKAPIIGNAFVKVSDVDGNTLANTTVKLFNDTHEYVLTTDENGTVVFENIDVGEYTVVASKDGYIEVKTNVTITKDETTNVEVVMEKEITTGTLNVFIQDIDGNVIPNTTVSINDKTYETDENGMLSIENLEQGEYVVGISKDGYVSKSYTVTITAKETAIMYGILEKEITTGSLTVNVTDMNGKALTDVTITIDDNTYITNENGQFVLTDLEAGKYTIMVSKNGYISESYDVTINAKETTILNIDLEEEVTAGQLDGEIRTFDNKGLEGALIVIQSFDGSYRQELTSDENGKFALNDLEAGSYTYTVTLDGYNTMSGDFVITAGEMLHMSITMAPTPVKGIAQFDVVNTDGEKLEGATITIVGQSIAAYKTDENGIVRVPDLPEGTYSYTVKLNGYITYEGTFTIGDTLITHIPVVLEKEPVVSNLFVNITDKDNQPLSGVTIKVEGVNYEHTFTTNENGEVVISDLLVGEYKVTAMLTGYTSNEVEIELTEFDHDLTIVLHEDKLPEETGETVVTVRDEKGNVLSNAEVVINRNDNSYYETFVTDENGQVKAELPVGTYYIIAFMDGYITDGATIDIEANKTIDVDLVLEKEIFNEKTNSLEIKIKNQFNEDVKNATVVLYDSNGKEVFNGVLNNQNILALTDLPAGHYTVVVSKTNHKATSVEFDINELGHNYVEVILEEIVEDVKAGALDVLVFDKDGNVLENVLITILNADGSRYGSYTVDRYGEVYLTAIPVGEYSVYASYQGTDSDKISFEIIGGQTKTVSIVIDETKKEEEKPNNPSKPSKPNKPSNPGGDKENIQTGDETLPKFGLLALLSAIGAFVSRKKKK